ncbi:MAG: hypothetical protein ACJA1Z_001066 [Patiriisocius sp.]|jgi:hypothetical protein
MSLINSKLLKVITQILAEQATQFEQESLGLTPNLSVRLFF